MKVPVNKIVVQNTLETATVIALCSIHWTSFGASKTTCAQVARTKALCDCDTLVRIACLRTEVDPEHEAFYSLLEACTAACTWEGLAHMGHTLGSSDDVNGLWLRKSPSFLEVAVLGNRARKQLDRIASLELLRHSPSSIARWPRTREPGTRGEITLACLGQ